MYKNLFESKLKTRYGIGIRAYCVIPRPGCSHKRHTNSSNGDSLLKLVGDFKTISTNVPHFLKTYRLSKISLYKSVT